MAVSISKMHPGVIIAVVLVILLILYFALSTKAATPVISPTTGKPIPTSNTQTNNLSSLLSSLFGNGVSSGAAGINATTPIDGSGCVLDNCDGQGGPLQGVYDKGICQPIGVCVPV